MIFAAMLGGLICRVLGHRDRRLRKSDADRPMPFPSGTGMAQIRICSRCGRLRAVKQRKKKEVAK